MAYGRKTKKSDKKMADEKKVVYGSMTITNTETGKVTNHGKAMGYGTTDYGREISLQGGRTVITDRQSGAVIIPAADERVTIE